MSDTGESTSTPQLREDLDAWLADRVEGTDRTTDKELERIVAVYRFATAGAETEADDEELPDAESLARLPDRLDETREDLEREIEDVRERVIQVLEKTHDRAEKGHAHPELDDSIDDLAARLESLEESLTELEKSMAAEELGAEVDSLRTDLEATTDRLEGFEERLGGVGDHSEGIEGKLDTLASAIVRLRTRTDRLEVKAETEDRLDELRREANRTGSRTADCGQCGRSVTVALLSGPNCPHCEATFRGLDPSRGFFGSATLVAEDRPALEGETAPESDVDDESDDPTEGDHHE
ncbi:hypothetical protein AArcSl_0277 [Halalkaliarchaeum desulfuricum]|uniref:CopG family transcriptional regulator n=1 Tax=Halalkaliarchaeum desulfuricum TaxID=2055893 RepID=A0A343TFR0_9EURY|nr:hypothetical protein [Halalkaliarchaeum desulfuricum]AUX07932.1 hypothetical protein AArcSl_0277 [Halalkaliarchaeum desulfuricum]